MLGPKHLIFEEIHLFGAVNSSQIVFCFELWFKGHYNQLSLSEKLLLRFGS